MIDTDRRILCLAVPALGTLTVEPMYVLVDTAIVGRSIGTAALGGLALASTVLTTLLWAFNFLATGTTTRVATLLGGGRRREAASVSASAVWLAVALGIVLAVVVAGMAGPLITALGGTGDVHRAATTYLRVSAVGMPLILITYAGHGHLRGRADTRTPFIVAAASNALNVVLDVVFVYGLRLGIAGSAWATVIAQAAGALALVVVMGRHLAADRGDLRPRPREAFALLVVARQLFVRTGALVAALAVGTSVAARMSPATLAAHQIAMQLSVLTALILDAIATAVQTLIASELGAGNGPAARHLANRALRMAMMLGVFLAVALAAGAGPLPRIFTSDDRVATLAMAAVLVLAVDQIAAAAAFTFDGVLAGAGDFGFMQRAMVLALALYVPAALSALWLGGGIVALWCAYLFWMCVRVVVIGLRVRGPHWSEPRPIAPR